MRILSGFGCAAVAVGLLSLSACAVKNPTLSLQTLYDGSRSNGLYDSVLAESTYTVIPDVLTIETNAYPPLLEASNADRFVDAAFNQLGQPYVFGGARPGGFDCSGLIQYAFKGLGRHVPRTTGELIQAGKSVGMDNAQRGDLMFFNFPQGRRSQMHVGIYLGNGKMLHASVGSKRVETTNVSTKYWQSRLLKVISLFKDNS